jgi:hypothetical protein
LRRLVREYRASTAFLGAVAAVEAVILLWKF